MKKEHKKRPIVDIDHKPVKDILRDDVVGWEIGSLKVLVPKDSKNKNTVRNWLFSSLGTKGFIFNFEGKRAEEDILKKQQKKA
jgi:hypothetical protein